MAKAKKRNCIRILACIATLTAISSMSISQSGYSNLISGHATDSVTSSDMAKVVALEDAGIQESDAKYVNVWLEYDNKLPQYYEVEFESNRIKYSYEIDLHSGDVLGKQTENYNDRNVSEADSSESTPAEIPDLYIAENSAEAVALEDAGIQKNAVEYIDVKLEYNEGLPQYYTVKFESSQIKYRYEIDMYSGEILKKHIENHDDQNISETDAEIPDSGYIGEDYAKKIALEDVGVQESDVKYINVWFEYEKGQPSCYVVKLGFRHEDNIRYKYEIDLYSGEVLSKSTECCGDVNSDGDVSVCDVIILQKYLLGSKGLTKEKYEVADINTDGSVDIFDLVSLKYRLFSK